jgi:hypothetical protein
MAIAVNRPGINIDLEQYGITCRTKSFFSMKWIPHSKVLNVVNYQTWEL